MGSNSKLGFYREHPEPPLPYRDEEEERGPDSDCSDSAPGSSARVKLPPQFSLRAPSKQIDNGSIDRDAASVRTASSTSDPPSYLPSSRWGRAPHHLLEGRRSRSPIPRGKTYTSHEAGPSRHWRDNYRRRRPPLPRSGVRLRSPLHSYRPSRRHSRTPPRPRPHSPPYSRSSTPPPRSQPRPHPNLRSQSPHAQTRPTCGINQGPLGHMHWILGLGLRLRTSDSRIQPCHPLLGNPLSLPPSTYSRFPRPVGPCDPTLS